MSIDWKVRPDAADGLAEAGSFDGASQDQPGSAIPATRES